MEYSHARVRFVLPIFPRCRSPPYESLKTTYFIYCCLSNDDERDGESVSIENQKLLLQNYVRQRGWNVVDTYIDDG